MLGKRKILVVENDIFQYTAISSFLQTKGFEILAMDNGEPVSSYEEALFILEKTLPDITILDIELNGKRDGIELAEYLQPLSVPVIFLTANDNEQNLERARQLLPKSFITKTEKPYDEKQLWNAVMMAMEYVEERKRLFSKGISLKVKEVKASANYSAKVEAGDSERNRKERLFEWDEIIYFYTGKDIAHNYTVIKTENSPDILYELKEPLSDFENRVPANFIRVNRNYIINVLKITEHDLPRKVYIGKEMISITETYKEIVPGRIKQILGI